MIKAHTEFLVRVASAVFVVLIFIGAAFVANERTAFASSQLGDAIVCLVYTDLNMTGTPVQHIFPSDCPDVPPTSTGTLKVTKVVVGGTNVSSDFSIHIKSGGTDISGSPQPGSSTGTSYIGITPGTYVVAETGPTTNYTASFSGACDSSGTVTVASSSTPSLCTITNTYVPPTTPASADLATTKTVSSSTPSVGGNITYTITVTNNGPDAASGVAVTDTLPTGVTYVSDDSGGAYNNTTGTWTVGSLANGAHATLNITVTVNAGTDSQSIVNTASATSTTADPNAGNNTSTPVTITPSAGSSGGGGGGNGNGGGGGGGGGNGGGGGGGTQTGTTTDSGGSNTQPPTNNGGGGSNGPIFGSSFGGSGNGPIFAVGKVLGASTSTLPVSCSPLLSTYMRLGKKNDVAEVKKLQTFLNSYMNAGLPVTGYFGTLTDAAVRKFQIKNAGEVLAPWVPYGLPDSSTTTGYVYKTTQRSINLAACATLTIPTPQLP